jgi:hypothetical protein
MNRSGLARRWDAAPKFGSPSPTHLDFLLHRAFRL